MGGRGGSSGMTSRNLLSIENRIRNNPTETAALVGPNGEVIFDKSDGLESAVYFTDEEASKMVDGTLTHNHPQGTTLSADDVDLAVSKGLKEIRAVHKDGYYSLTRQFKIGDQTPSYYAEFSDRYDNAIGKYMKLKVDPIWNRTGDADRCNKMVSDFRRQWLKNNASQFGWEYKEGN